MFGMGPAELALVVVAILLLFGAKRLPEIARGLGEGIREFKRAMHETTNEVKGSVDVKPPEVQAPKPPEPVKKDNPYTKEG